VDGKHSSLNQHDIFEAFKGVFMAEPRRQTLLGSLFLRSPSFPLRLCNLLPRGSGQGPFPRRFLSGPGWAAAALGFSRSGEKVPRVL
jgi:hypothetical protein